jgi:hypothetical protein
MRTTGKYNKTIVTGEEVAAFIPDPLPPKNPALNMDDETTELLHKAEHALSRLALAGEMVPSIDWFIYGFVRKEAVVSSQIEGTQATLVDLLKFEADTVEPAPNADIAEICNYVEALSFARAELNRDDGLPLSMRLLNQIHYRLMQGVRGKDKLPGEIRRSQNWIGCRSFFLCSKNTSTPRMNYIPSFGRVCSMFSLKPFTPIWTEMGESAVCSSRCSSNTGVCCRFHCCI